MSRQSLASGGSLGLRRCRAVSLAEQRGVAAEANAVCVWLSAECSTWEALVLEGVAYFPRSFRCCNCDFCASCLRCFFCMFGSLNAG